MSTCPSCHSPDLVGFKLAPSGEPVNFRHCRACEHRWWENEFDGDVIVLRQVLERIATA